MSNMTTPTRSNIQNHHHHHQQQQTHYHHPPHVYSPSLRHYAAQSQSQSQPVLNTANSNNNNNNNNNNNVVMERVLFQLHHRVCCFTLRYTQPFTRRLVEHLLLVIGILGFGALILLHCGFVYRNHSHNNLLTNHPQQAQQHHRHLNCATTCWQHLETIYPHPNQHQYPKGQQQRDSTVGVRKRFWNEASTSQPDIIHVALLPPNAYSSSTTSTRSKSIIFNRNSKYNRKKQSSCSLRTTRDNNDNSVDADSKQECDAKLETSLESKDDNDNDKTDWNVNSIVKDLTILYSYSKSKAYLLLPLDHDLFLKQDFFTVAYVLVNPQDPYCFGEPFLQTLIHNVIGYDTIVLNWLLAYDDSYINENADTNINNAGGFVYHPKTGQLQELKQQHTKTCPSSSTKTETKKTTTSTSKSHTPTSFALETLWSMLTGSSSPDSTVPLVSWVSSFLSSSSLSSPLALLPSLLSKISVLIQTSFLYFFCSTLISFTLRETQERMLEFTQELSRRVRIQLPLQDLITKHVVHNLVFCPIMVGMMFFLIEFYNGDKFLAFLVMSIVFLVEAFMVISLRSSQGITFFPKIFFLLFCLFHVYYFANPSGFVYTALVVVACFMFHSMAFFWHRYELPAVALGRVTVDRPRMMTTIGTGNSTGGGGGGGGGNPTTTSHGNNNDNSNVNSIIHYPPITTVTTTTILPSSPPPPIRTTTTAYSPVSNNNNNYASRGTRPFPLPNEGNQEPQQESQSVVNNNNNNNTLLEGQSSHPSFSTTSSVRSTTMTTSGMLLRGGEDDYDYGYDEESSYVYFMGGEVVVHQRCQPQPQPQSQPIITQRTTMTNGEVLSQAVGAHGCDYRLSNRNSDSRNGVEATPQPEVISIGFDVSELNSSEEYDDDGEGECPSKTKRTMASSCSSSLLLLHRQTTSDSQESSTS